MNKKKIIGGIILIVAVAYLIINYRSTPTNVEQATVVSPTEQVATSTPTFKNVDLTFTGFGPAGKKHEGKFAITTISGSEITFEMKSISTGIEKLDQHLCSDDFFLCEQFPQSKFVLKSVDVQNDRALVVGDLKVKDATQQVSFMANKAENYSGEFLLDSKPFNFKFVGVDQNILIKFNFTLN